ncbi:MAG: dTDP-4-dehydrorhamnose 3,5-epimerase [Omnitrophica bacterium RIFCSPHIGHO2_02_FULL_51_18]|nr:MAG: dTDP-4-dehydrorhamnose 3,5-epimerase [Omnitrophica bacterium RIFCSPHIGHO2_02_FULL_51_18]
MIFTETKLKGAFVIDIDKKEDARGFFARTFCQKEFREHGLNPNFVQANVSYNDKKGTMRGMHIQAAPHCEAKLVRCAEGALFDVIVDLRKNSSTFKQWFGIELSRDNFKMLFIPEGFAHGFVTLTNHTQILYQMSEFYAPGFDRGFRYNDPAFAIKWPVKVAEISEKDASWPLFASVPQGNLTC